MPRILNVTGTVYPKAEIQSVSAEHGVATFRWLDVSGNPVDSGGSVARFTALEAGEDGAYPAVPDETLQDAIENPLPSSPQTVFTYSEFVAHCDTRVPGFSARILEARRASTDVDHWVNVAVARNAVHLDSPDLDAAFALFVSAALMTAEERTAILTP
jgi:hypothetical protein